MKNLKIKNKENSKKQITALSSQELLKINGGYSTAERQDACMKVYADDSEWVEIKERYKCPNERQE